MAKGAYIFVTYPESTKWEDIAEWCNHMGYEWSRSPLHDKDVNEDGTQKKPHYHWIVGLRKGFTSCKEWHNLFSESFEHGTPYVEVCRDIEAAVDYQSHEDCPDKAHYDKNDIVKSDYFIPEDFVTTEQKRLERKKDKESNVTSILSFIIEYGITEFFQLVDYVVANHPEMVGDLLQNNHFFSNYIKSLHFYKVSKSALAQELDDVKRELRTTREEHKELLEMYVHVYNCAKHELEQKGESVPDAWTKPF